MRLKKGTFVRSLGSYYFIYKISKQKNKDIYNIVLMSVNNIHNISNHTLLKEEFSELKILDSTEINTAKEKFKKSIRKEIVIKTDQIKKLRKEKLALNRFLKFCKEPKKPCK